MNDFVKEWDSAYSSEGTRHKNKYPSEMVVSWVLKNYNVSNKKTYRVLDIGCGWGNNLKFLIENGFDAYGVEQSTVACEYLKEYYPEKIIHGSISDLPFESNFFHFLIDRNSIQHNKKKYIRIILRECKRVLKRNGRILSLISKTANNDFSCSKFNERELIDLFSDFKNLKVDIQRTTFNNKTSSNSNFIIEGTK